jgi:hypothetical protein
MLEITRENVKDVPCLIFQGKIVNKISCKTKQETEMLNFSAHRNELGMIKIQLVGANVSVGQCY